VPALPKSSLRRMGTFRILSYYRTERGIVCKVGVNWDLLQKIC
jgi:hypothetical protein